MGSNGKIPGPGGDDTARSLKRLYNRGMAIGIGAIILSAILFCGAMYLIVSEQSLLNFIMVGVSVCLMVACFIVVTIRLRKLQSGWFGAAADSAQDYVSGLAKKIREDQQNGK